MTAIFTMNETDLRAWQLVSDVPKLGNVWAYVCAFLNVVLPGIGTILSSILGDANINKTQLMVGVFQFLTAITLIGFIWSVYWAYLLIIESQGDHSEIKRLLGNQNNGSAANAGAGAGANRGGRRLNPYDDME